ncbi:hypothetical protein LguiA_025222 [Lonicera macranthoides]
MPKRSFGISDTQTPLQQYSGLIQCNLLPYETDSPTDNHLSTPTTVKMKTLIPITLTRQLSLQLLPPLFLFHFPSLSRKNSNFLTFSKCICTPKSLTLCSATSSESVTYGGWGDLELGIDSVNTDESNQLRNFFSSLGIDDKRYIFVYLLGFVCALAISRVRVSSIIVFPACVVVFAFGFSFGFVNGGHMNDLSLLGTKKKLKDDGLRVSVENLRNLVDLFDVKLGNLNNDIRRGIKSNLVTVGDLEGYIQAIESIGLSALNTKNVAEGIIGKISVENQEVERTSNQKLSKRKKEVNGNGFDFSQFVSGLFKGNSKTNKVKDIVKREMADIGANDHIRQNILAPASEKQIPSYVNVANDYVGGRILDTAEELVERTRKMQAIGENEKMSFMGFDSGAKSVFESKQYIFENNELRIMDNDLLSFNNGHHNSIKTQEYQDDLLDLDVSVSHKHMRNEAYFEEEQKFKRLNGNYRPSRDSKNETYRACVREDRVIPENEQSHSGDFDSSLSAMVSDDMVFNGYLTEANILLKKARQHLSNRGDKGDVEKALYKSAKILSKAIEMKPMSLLAVGQLGNTYLLHGELKLKISRKLRTLLARGNDSLSVESSKLLNVLGEQLTSKEKVGSVLVDVCEECEELLVKAGRKYRLALSIDGNDMRALYNWGLALSFRAQLIADIGPEAAFDADKVFLAAIDKFDAMMSKSNVYAPDALFRWGVALQQRSRLQTRKSREKVKLLEQAKSMYEDALHMDSNNLQVREALSSCISELNYCNY